jgi:CTP synthase (UTP-ammonia lyase)
MTSLTPPHAGSSTLLSAPTDAGRASPAAVPLSAPGAPNPSSAPDAPGASAPGAVDAPAVGVPATMTRAAAPFARVALVGDRSADVAAHGRVPDLLDALRRRDGLALDAYWVPTDEIPTDEVATDEIPTDEVATDEIPTDEVAAVGAPGAFDGFDGIWLVPGSPYASEAGALAAVRTARERGIPFLGTCGGLQHVALEFARSVCGLPDAAHAEVDPHAPDPLIVPIACALNGHEGVVLITRDSLAERVIGADRTVERYYCSYGISPRHAGLLLARGLRFSGVDGSGEARIIELPGHPFFLATLFQPELGSDANRPHPIIRGFAEAAVARAAGRRAAARTMPRPVG